MTIYVEIFKTDITVFICDVTQNDKFQYQESVLAQCELRTDVMFLWIKVSSVIQTLSAPHIKGKIFNFLRKEKVNVQLCILIDLKTDRIKDIDNYFL